MRKEERKERMEERERGRERGRERVRTDKSMKGLERKSESRKYILGRISIKRTRSLL